MRVSQTFFSRGLAIAFTVFVFISLIPIAASHGQRTGLSAMVDSMATLLEETPRSLDERFRVMARTEPKAVTNDILPRLNQAVNDSARLTKLVLMIAQTHDSALVDTIISIAKSSPYEYVRFNCLWALSQIGAKRAGEFIMQRLSAYTDPDVRHSILDFLARLQYTEALPQSEEVLKLDLEESYWKLVLLFGKFGEGSVPFLLKHLDSPDVNVRMAAAYVLGQWITPAQASRPFMDRFWKETDHDVKVMIIGTIADLEVNHDSVRAFYREIVRREPEWDTTALMRGEQQYLKDVQKHLEEFRKTKKISKTAFDKEYALLYESSGLEGDYDLLAASSTIADEPRLLKLRTIILRRDSDEAFIDYHKITQAVIFNRMLALD